VGSSEPSTGPHYTTQIIGVTEKLWAWRRRLPPQLLLDLTSDCKIDQSQTSRVHQLQALSLQLTFENLLIIFHRPLIAKQVDHLIRTQPESGLGAAASPATVASADSPFFTNTATSPLARMHMSSTEQWWDAALRTSKVTELPRLSQLATDSHLVAFLAINLFNSAIVMAVLALSDPLSDRAQEVKRTITRIFRLQELLGKKTQLSMQSNVVLKDVIQMLLRREADAMFGSSDLLTTQSGAPLMSVEDTLRLPLDEHHRPQQNMSDRVQRVNESLASVQKGKSSLTQSLQAIRHADVYIVFPAGVDSVYNHDRTTGQHWSQDGGDSSHLPNEDWSQADLQDFNLEGDLEWVSDDNGVNTTGNGLYWFWDSVWSEPQP
jgi:hypothetical protein